MVYNLAQSLESSYNTAGASDNPWHTFSIVGETDPITQGGTSFNPLGLGNYQHDPFHWLSGGNGFLVTDLMGQSGLFNAWNVVAPSNSPRVMMQPKPNVNVLLHAWTDQGASNNVYLLLKLVGSNNDWIRIDADGLDGNLRQITGQFEVVNKGRYVQGTYPDFGSLTPSTNTQTIITLDRWMEIPQGGGGGGGGDIDPPLEPPVWVPPTPNPDWDPLLGDDLIDNWLKQNNIEDQPFALIGLILVVAFGYVIFRIWGNRRG